MMGLHEALKIGHLFSVAVWIGAMLASALLLTRLPGGTVMAKARLVLSPLMGTAMLAAIAFGLAMGMESGWISQRWVHLKLALAFVLAALQGVISGQMRRTSAVAEPRPAPAMSHLPFVICAIVLTAIVVAVTKP
jgi:uncharacterized membrane protein